MAMPMAMSWWNDTFTSSTVMPSDPKNGEMEYTRRLGQMMGTSATRPKSRPMVTTTLVTSETPSRPRMMTRSMIRPIAGATTSRTSASDTRLGRPHPFSNCQKAKAPTTPTAPWAKLKMPVVV